MHAVGVLLSEVPHVTGTVRSTNKSKLIRETDAPSGPVAAQCVGYLSHFLLAAATTLFVVLGTIPNTVVQITTTNAFAHRWSPLNHIVVRLRSFDDGQSA